MLKDVSEWEHIGYGGNSTLQKEELKSPIGSKYIIKYPRKFEKGISWEDVTELIAAEIGTIYGLEMMKVEIVTRNGERGCLLRNFVDELHAKGYEEGGVLLEIFAEGYNELQESDVRNIDLIDKGFTMLTQFEYWESIKEVFLDMLLFDILIGNQDRHPFNWQILYFDSGYRFSPIYDNGASLGFRFEDQQLHETISNPIKLDRYVRKTRVKAGMFERKSVKASDLLSYIQVKFPKELQKSIKKLGDFDVVQYQAFIQSLDLLSEAQKEWLLLIIPYRRTKILEWVGEEEEDHE